jgi:hypothetical protein
MFVHILFISPVKDRAQQCPDLQCRELHTTSLNMILEEEARTMEMCKGTWEIHAFFKDS